MSRATFDRILASLYPGEVGGLILVDIVPPDQPAKPYAIQQPAPFATRDEALDWLRKRYPKFAEGYYQSRLKHGFVEGDDGSFVAKPVGHANMVSMDTDLWPYVEKIRVPTLLIKGGDSGMATPEKVERMRKMIPDFEVVTVRGATHMVPQDQPVEFDRAVRKFLTRVEK